MKVKVILFFAMVLIGVLFYIDKELEILNLYWQVGLIVIQSILIVVNTYNILKKDKPREFESDDILDC